MTEYWKPVLGYEGFLEVTQLGKVRTLDRYVTNTLGTYLLRGRVRKQVLTGNKGYQYYTVQISINKIKKNLKVHRLVAEAFIPNPENKPCINHKDGNKLNNHVDNLEWCTHSENSQHAVDTGLWNHARGEAHAKTDLTNEDVVRIRELRKLGMSSRKLTAMYPQVCRRTIMNIYQNKTWNHI